MYGFMMNPGLRRDISPCHSGLSGNSLRLGRRKRSYKNEKDTQFGFQSINSIGRMFTSNG
jgi:hypothetical protein